MRAVIVKEFGGPAVMQIEEVNTPSISPYQVLIQVKAAGINSIDWKSCAGKRVINA